MESLGKALVEDELEVTCLRSRAYAAGVNGFDRQIAKKCSALLGRSMPSLAIGYRQ